MSNRTISRTEVIIIGFLVIVLICILGGSGWWYFYGPCGKTVVEKSLAGIYDQMNAFLDAASVAGTTSRIALSTPISDLQEIRRTTDKIETPACLIYGKTKLVSSMENTIQSLLAFQGNSSDSIITGYIEQAADDMEVATNELLAVMECAPFCNYDESTGLSNK